MNGKLRAFGLRDMVAVVAIMVALIAIGIPTLAHPHRLNKRQMCAVNLKGIGTSAKIYANDNNERWMIPPFSKAAIDNEGIDYLAGNHVNQHPTNPGEVGYDREVESQSDTRQNDGVGSKAVSVTRAFWMMVRSGDILVDQFICPSSRDVVADEQRVFELDWFYDFQGYDNISYGYQVPFGPRDTRPREGMDNRQPLAADKGPYYLNNFEPTFQAGSRNPVDFNDPLGRWHRYNSPNHQGRGQLCGTVECRADRTREQSMPLTAENENEDMQHAALWFIGPDMPGLLRLGAKFVADHNGNIDKDIADKFGEKAVVFMSITAKPDDIKRMAADKEELKKQSGCGVVFQPMRQPTVPEGFCPELHGFDILTDDAAGLVVEVTSLLADFDMLIVGHTGERRVVPGPARKVQAGQKFVVMLPEDFDHPMFGYKLGLIVKQYSGIIKTALRPVPGLLWWW